uniref:Uncharacterized protein n=1 Tax=Vespula pensylvanica TaxID=30213 RepID=A0A834NRF6_VESPE|nr:hypothetical protein H0235_011196 [Vespula pensylvanica]
MLLTSSTPRQSPSSRTWISERLKAYTIAIAAATAAGRSLKSPSAQGLSSNCAKKMARTISNSPDENIGKRRCLKRLIRMQVSSSSSSSSMGSAHGVSFVSESNVVDLVRVDFDF